MDETHRAILFVIILISMENEFVGAYSGKVLLISMDGFRWDYPTMARTPNLTEFARKGVKAPYVDNTFITKTFPNHYTIVTGLYEENHGIINNRMYDPDRNATFGYSSHETFWWEGGEPIWITAKKNGKKAGTYFWVGSETEIQNIRPDIWFPYSNNPPYLSRVDTVVDWFTNRSIDIDVATLYFPEPDSTGHRYGPNSNEVREKVQYMDAVLGHLMNKFDEHGLWSTVNVMLTSDHGMTDIDVRNKVIDISEYISLDSIAQMPASGPTANILPKNGMIDEVFEKLNNAHPNMTVYRREDIPEFFHYKHNQRILPILAVADEGWVITTNRTAEAEDYDTYKATHGYDNRLMSMKPIFYARGPDFRSNYVGKPFHHVDVYPLMCKLLGITPAPNNGSLSKTAEYLTVTGSPSGKRPLIPSVFGIILVLSGLAYVL